MSAAKHTPGPWDIFTIGSPAGVSYRIFAESEAGPIDIAHIPMAWSGDGPNARLIAAAPDLAEALKQALEVIGSQNVNAAIRDLAFATATAALKKAGLLP